MKDLGGCGVFKGYYGDLAIVVAKTSYVAEDGTEKRYLPEGTLVLGNTGSRGHSLLWCHSGCTGVVRRCGGLFPLSETLADRGRSGREFTMTQSAPLMVLPGSG
ncbi:major capsid protein [Escherichia coli]|uniref:major capsid protein n=1 Tax=Escherichia coli TaxID=562 RepID=UPI002FCD2EA6